jgi:hypothetical protein
VNRSPMQQSVPSLTVPPRLEPELLRAVIQQESAFYPCAVSAKRSQGLTVRAAAIEQLAMADPFDAKASVDATPNIPEAANGEIQRRPGLSLGGV